MKYHIEFDIEVPDHTSENEVDEWARYMTGESGEIYYSNPLINKSFDPIFGSFKMRKVE